MRVQEVVLARTVVLQVNTEPALLSSANLNELHTASARLSLPSIPRLAL